MDMKSSQKVVTPGSPFEDILSWDCAVFWQKQPFGMSLIPCPRQKAAYLVHY